MSTPLNLHLLTAEELLKYPTPLTELEIAMAEALKGLLKDAEQESEQLSDMTQELSDERRDRERYEAFYDAILSHHEFVTSKPWFAPEPDDEPLIEAIKDLMTGERPAPKQVDTSPKEPKQLSSGFTTDCID